MKPVLLGLLGLVSLTGVFGQTIAEDELKKKLQDVTFVNYVGPYAYVNTRAEIKAVGETMGTALKAQGKGDWNQLYTVQRVWEKNPGKLSADILSLAPGAGVDHIRNLNLIISGYLEKAFGYKAEESALLADFITRYNAVYRGDMTYVQASFLPGVAAQVTKDKVGLSKVFSEWPGKTQILIPLRDTLSAGTQGKVNADEVSNREVMNTLKDDKKTLDDRKAITDLKDKEITEEQKAIQAKEEELKRRQEELDKKKNDPTNTTTGNQTKPGDNKTDPGKNPTDNKTDPGKTTSTTGTSTTTTTSTTSSTTTPSKTLADEQKKIDEEKKALEAAKTENAKRDAALQEDRKTIAAEEKKNQTTDAATTPGASTAKPQVNPVVFLRVNSSTELGQLVVVDTKTKAQIMTSDINSVRNKIFQVYQNQLLMIAGKTEGSGAIRIMLLKKEDLSPLSQGTEDIHPKSLLVVNGSQFYAVVKNKTGAWVLGLFDQTLKSQVQSEISVQPDSAVSLGDGLLILHDDTGKIVLLDPKTLKKVNN